MRLSKFMPILLVLVPFLFPGCTSMLLVKSSWSANKIVVDGNAKDWGDALFYIPDAELTAGIRNDSKYLYIVLKTTNRRQAFQLRGLGLTIWFDPTGGTGEDFGIHFPIGRFHDANFRRDMDTPSDSERQNATFVMRNPNELELLGVNPNGPERLSVTDLKGIELQMRTADNGLTYELRVPLHSSASDPYAINPKGDKIGVGFVGGKFERPSGFEGRRGRRGDFGGEGGEMPGGEGGEGGEMPGGMEGGGYGGGYGGGGYGRGDRGQNEHGERRQPPKQIKFWLRVDLAGGPHAAPTIR